jgi:Raf kinase inhibitor-like YbhB/YbcL family protein
MERAYFIIGFIILAAGSIFLLLAGPKASFKADDQNPKVGKQSLQKLPDSNIQKESQNSMTISSPFFYDNGGLPIFATCDGQGVNPPFEISGVPKEAKSLALIVHDPDAPNGTFIHWTVWNIDPATIRIKQNSVPDNAVQGITSANRVGYVAACPPSGTHCYIFNLYALDEVLDLPPSTTAAELKHAIEGHVLDNTSMTGLYR